MKTKEAVQKFKALALSMARSAATEHVLMSEEDLFQEANIAILKAASQPNFPVAPNEQTKFVRCCILNAFRNIASSLHNEAPGVLLSLDEEIGEDEGGNPITRHDVIGVESKQEEHEATSRASDKALKKLSQKDREMLVLHTQGRTIDEIGEIYGVSHQAVSQRLKKARQALKVAGQSV